MDDKVCETRGSSQSADAKRHAIVTVQSDAAPAGKEPRATRQTKKFVVLIAGMHRSGTSALTRMFSLLGCDLPSNLEPANPSNEAGHWESRPILLLNDEILASAGLSWDDWEAFNPAWCDSPVRDGFLERAVKTLEEEFRASRLFVLKDPRICRLLPFWIEALEAFGATPRVVCPLRNPMEVAASLERRDGIDPSIGRLLWLRYMLDAEAHSRGLKRAFLRYDTLLAGWRSLPDRLGRELGITWPRRSSAVGIEIDGFLSPALRHHAEEDTKVLVDPDLSCWIGTSFEIFDRWARGQGRDKDCDELDRIRVTFDEAAPAFARLVFSGRQAARRAATLGQELATAREGSAGLEATVTAKQAELGQREAELTEAQGRVGELEAALAAQGIKLTRREVELAETQGRVGDLEAVVAAKEMELTRREVELAETQGRVGDLEAVVAAKETDLDRRGAELTEAQGRVGELEAALAAQGMELTRREVELAETQGRVGDLEAVVAAKETDLDRRGAELTEAQGRVGELEAALAAQGMELTRREVELAETQGRVGDLEAVVVAKEREVVGLRQAVAAQAPLRWAGLALKRARYSAIGFPVTRGARALMTWSRAPLRDWRAARAIRRSELFDRDWYLKTYPDVATLGIDPVRHYVAFGAREGRDPGPNFSTRTYLADHADVELSGLNPLKHYLRWGIREGRTVRPAQLSPAESAGADASYMLTSSADARYVRQYFTNATFALGSHSGDYGAKAATPPPTERCDVSLIAYYLPQFHPIPENDIWWGAGFTEWRNVTRAFPVYQGHEQPKLPGELGFYDLRAPGILEKQIELAKLHGISVFCFHFYWFAGKTLLEAPIRIFRDRPDLELGYCLCWANENWTRRWDGAEDELLIGQSHSPHDDIEFIRYVAKYFEDRRYLRVDGKPVLVVYRPSILPDARKTVQRWREESRRLGFPDLFVVATNSFGFTRPEDYGFDALTEFPPHGVSAPVAPEVVRLHPDYAGTVYSYPKLVEGITSSAPSMHNPRVLPGVMPAWDNTPRRPLNGNVFHDSSPSLFYRWLSHAIARARLNPPEARFVFINAWNEWAEGAFLEPSRTLGYAYLAACRTAVLSNVTPEIVVTDMFRRSRETYSVRSHRAIAVHIYYEDQIDNFAQALSAFGDSDLFLTVPRSMSYASALRLKNVFPTAYIQEVDNVGRDIRPFLLIYPQLIANNYEFACKLHTKKSTHMVDGDRWGAEMVRELLGPSARAAMALCADDKHIGILAPCGTVMSLGDLNVRLRSEPILRWLAPLLGCMDFTRERIVAGSMFWFRPAALERLHAIFTRGLEFEAELGQVDGTMAHAIERCFCLAASASGMKTIEYGDRPVFRPVNWS